MTSSSRTAPRRLAKVDLPEPPEPITKIFFMPSIAFSQPSPLPPRNNQLQREVASDLRSFSQKSRSPIIIPTRTRPAKSTIRSTPRLDLLYVFTACEDYLRR